MKQNNNCIFSYFLVIVLKMYFTFHQICKKDNCTHSFLFCVLLAAFDEHGACSLTELQNKKLLLYLLLLWSENVLKF